MCSGKDSLVVEHHGVCLCLHAVIAAHRLQVLLEVVGSHHKLQQIRRSFLFHELNIKHLGSNLWSGFYEQSSLTIPHNAPNIISELLITPLELHV